MDFAQRIGDWFAGLWAQLPSIPDPTEAARAGIDWLMSNVGGLSVLIESMPMLPDIVAGIRDSVQWLVDQVRWLHDNVPSPGSIAGEAAGVVSSAGSNAASTVGQFLSNLNPFADGGVVPGPPGSPQPILAHAGEMVLTPGMQRGVLAAVQGLAAGPAAYAPPARMLTAGATVSVTIGDVIVNADSPDAPAIGLAVRKEMETVVRRVMGDAMRTLVSDSTGKIRR